MQTTGPLSLCIQPPRKEQQGVFVVGWLTIPFDQPSCLIAQRTGSANTAGWIGELLEVQKGRLRILCRRRSKLFLRVSICSTQAMRKVNRLNCSHLIKEFWTGSEDDTKTILSSPLATCLVKERVARFHLFPDNYMVSPMFYGQSFRLRFFYPRFFYPGSARELRAPSIASLRTRLFTIQCYFHCGSDEGTHAFYLHCARTTSLLGTDTSSEGSISAVSTLSGRHRILELLAVYWCL